MNNKLVDAFLALVRGGLWDSEVRLSAYGSLDFMGIYQLAEEQTVVGIVAAGLDHVVDVKVPQESVLLFVGAALQIEQQNKLMNDFVARLTKKLLKGDVYGLLVKGQGVAQCYERPLWRTSGDIDLLLDEKNYEKAKALLLPLADDVQSEDKIKKHQAIIIKDFDIELHGKMPFGLSKRADKVVDEAITDSLRLGGVRIWRNDEMDVYLPNADNDVILVFTHFLRHFFIEGIGLRQICDWCRLLWTYRDSLNYGLLESRIQRAELMSEWQVFGTLAIEHLGMPAKAMPFYKDSLGMRRKAKRVLERVVKSGNFGHNKDLSYRSKYTGFAYRLVALWRRFFDFMRLVPIFPMDTPRFFASYLLKKVG